MKNYLILILGLLSLSTHAQRIDSSKKKLTSTQNNTNSNSNSSNRSSSVDLGDGSVASAIVEAIIFVTYYSVIGNYEMEDHLNNPITPYPYFDGNSGNYLTNGNKEKVFRTDIENNFLFEDNNSYGNHFKVKGHLMQYVYAQFDHYYQIEKYMGNTSDLAFYQFQIGTDRIRLKRFNFGFSLGATHFSSGINKTGFSLGLHSEAFIIKNISLDSSLNWCFVNENVTRNFDIKGRYHFKNLFISVGVENYKIGNPIYNYVSFGGGVYF